MTLCGDSFFSLSKYDMGARLANKFKYFIFIYLWIVCHIKGHEERGPKTFSLRLGNLLEALGKHYQVSDGIKRARENIREHTLSWSQEEKDAALLINIYTDPFVTVDTQGTPFYRRLNTELRSGKPEDIWVRCETLINEALDIIGQGTFDHLYRGERVWSAPFPEDGDVFYVRSFISTTLDPSTAGQFGGATDFFYHIVGAKGVLIQNISVTKDEQEVLIKSESEFILARKLHDRQEIQNELKNIKNEHSGFDLTTFYPKLLITLMDKDFFFKMKTVSPSTCRYFVCETSIYPHNDENRSESKIISKYLLFLLLFIITQLTFFLSSI